MNRLMKKHSCCRTTYPFIAIGCLLFAPSGLAWGEPVEPTESNSTTITPSYWSTGVERETQYAALSRDVEALQRQLGIVKRVIRLVTPTVVHVEARPASNSTPQLHIEEEGSGVIVHFGSNDYVLTNRHVIHRSKKNQIRIHLADGQVVQPLQIWGDPATDVAVMAIDQPGLIAARLGNSDRLEIGEFVLAIGSPFGLSQSVTRGIVSAKGRYDLDLGNGELKFMNFIQTDAAINPGNSGGPLVNLRGEVVGLNTAIASSGGGNEGIGFTIPINVVVQIAQDLVQDKEPPRGFLGVKLDSRFTVDRARSLGLPSLVGTRVTAVEENSPAELVDVHVDDVIIAYDGVRVERDDHLISLVKLTKIGEEISMVLFRDGQSLQKQVTIGDLRQRSHSAP